MNIIEILLACLQKHELNRGLSLRHSSVSWYITVTHTLLSVKGRMTEFRESL